jgi:hypothetical protein
MTGDRIEVLEWQVTLLWWRFRVMAALLALCVLGLGYLWHRQQSPVVEAQAFVLKDAHGEVAYALRVRPEPIAPPEGWTRGVFNRPYVVTVENGARREVLTISYEGVKESR